MKVIMFEPFISLGEFLGGDAKQLVELSSRLKNKGFEVEFLDYNLSDKLIYRDIKFLLKFLTLSAKKLKGDVVYASGTSFFGFMASVLGKKLRIPTVLYATHLSSLGPTMAEGRRLMRLSLQEGGARFFLANLKNNLKLPILNIPELIKQKTIVKRGLQNVSQIIASCEYMKKYVLSLVPRKNISVIYPGLDIPNFSKMPQSDSTILYFGALDSRRGIIDLICSYSDVMKKTDHAKLVIAGYPVYERGTQQLAKLLIKKYNLRSVKIVGYRSDISKIINQASITCLPFRYPVYQPPLTLLEAMALAKPVLTTNVGANSEFIQNNKTGLLVRPGDTKALTEKILFLLQNKNIAKKFGQRAKKYSKEKCNWKNTTQQVISVLEQVTKK